jgi:transposase
MAERRPYPTDLSDAEWELVAPLIPEPKPGGRPPVHERRDVGVPLNVQSEVQLTVLRSATDGRGRFGQGTLAGALIGL